MESLSFYWNKFAELDIISTSIFLLTIAVLVGLIVWLILLDYDKLRKTIVCQIVKVTVVKEYDSPYYFPVCFPQISLFEGMTYSLDYPTEYFEPPKRVKAILTVNHKGEICTIAINELKNDFENRDLSVGSMMTARCRQLDFNTPNDFKLIKLLACQLI